MLLCVSFFLGTDFTDDTDFLFCSMHERIMGDVATIPLFQTNPTYNYDLLAIIKYRLVTPRIFSRHQFFLFLFGGGCFTVNADLSIDVPCVDYKGSLYGFTLKYYDRPNDDGLYRRLDNDTLITGTGSDCIAIGADLSMPVSCAEYGGKKYGFTLLFYPPASDDPPGLYWQLDMGTLVGKQ